MERRRVAFIRATTENPSFQLFRRCFGVPRSIRLPLSKPAKSYPVRRAYLHPIAASANWKIHIEDELLEEIAAGSKRRCPGGFEHFRNDRAVGENAGVTGQAVLDALQQKVLLYDKSGRAF